MRFNPLRFQSCAVRLLLGAALGGLLVLAGPVAPARAQNERLDLMSLYQVELRALAMGNAFGALARGESALLYNPAGLAQRSFDVKFDASLALEGESGAFFSDTMDLLTTGSSSAASVQNYLTTYLGTEQNYRAQTYINGVANLGATRLGVGGGDLSQTRYTFSFEDNGPVPGTLDFTDTLRLTRQELALRVVSAAFQMADGALLLGATLKTFTYDRKVGTASFDTVIQSSSIELATTGASYNGSGTDLGAIWRMEALPFLRAQWSVTAYNFGGVSLASAGNATLDVPATYNVGLAINPELPWSPVHLLLAIELEDATGALRVRDAAGTDHERSSAQRLHYGAELGVWETSTGNHLLSLRVGSHRGQPTWGYELNLFSSLRFVYVRYTEDLGYAGASDLHAYDAAQLTLGFAF